MIFTYYHINKFRSNYLNNLGFNSFTQIIAHAHHVFSSPNANYDPDDHHLRFSDGQGISGYNSFAREDKIIYHEYTHAVTDYVASLYYNPYAPTESAAIHEGNSDYFAASFTGRYLIGDYACPSYQRNITNPIISTYSGYQARPDYPNVEAHDGGELWSACLWDLRDDLGSTVADEIIYDALYAIPTGSTFLQYREAILKADVNDYSGSHLNTIAYDFYLRGIGNNVQTVSGTMQSSQTWSQYVQLSGNVSVPSGFTLSIVSTAVVNLINGSSSYSIVSTGGTITLSSDAAINGLRAKIGSTGQYGLCGSIQTAVNNTDYSNNIYIQSGTFSESFSVANKSSIIYIYGDGQTSSYINGNITVTNSYYPQIYDLTTRYLSISSCNNPRVSEVTVVPWAEDSDGSLFSNSNTNLYLIDVTLNNTPDSYGAYFSGSSGQVYPVNGTYFENNQLATYFINSSSFTLSNVHFCENDYDISTDASSSVLAQNVTFSGNPANTTVGNVSYGSYSTCSLGKTSSIASNEDNKKDFAYDEFQKLNVLYQDLLAKINSEKVQEYNITKGKYSNDIKAVIEQCKSFIDKNPTSCFAPAAISLASHSYKQIEDYEGMKTFVSGIMEDKDLLNLYNNAKRNLMDYYNYKEDYEKSLSIADEILNSKPSDENLICDLLLSKGLMYEYRMGKKEEAIKQYELMISGYPQSGITKFAKKQLENLGINEDYEIPKETTELTEIAEFESSNHPNPFNPTTTISYTLPEAGAVQVKIYDVLGREVAKLVDEQKSAGKYTVQWNGSNYASGIYFYSVTFGGQRLYKKMLMIK